MRERFHDLLHEEKQYIGETETLIYIQGNQMIATWHDGDALCEVSGDVSDKLKVFLDWLYDENQWS